MDLFGKLTDRWGYERCVVEPQDDFEKFHLRNHIPRVVTSYWIILNEPRMTAFQRCIPFRHYYDGIAQDSPGFQPTALPWHHPLRIAAERNSKSRNSTQFNTSDRNSNAFHSNRNSSTTERSSRSLDPDPLYTWANEKVTQNRARKYHADRLSLEEIEEVTRLTELVDLIKKGKPPRYYASMRDKDIMRARSDRAQNQEPPPWLDGNSISGYGYTQIAIMYDAYQNHWPLNPHKPSP
jgi:hypothetical protein